MNISSKVFRLIVEVFQLIFGRSIRIALWISHPLTKAGKPKLKCNFHAVCREFRVNPMRIVFFLERPHAYISVGQFSQKRLLYVFKQIYDVGSYIIKTVYWITMSTRSHVTSSCLVHGCNLVIQTRTHDIHAQVWR